MDNLITGGVAVFIFVAFVGGLAESIGEIPFVLIVTGVVIAVVVDYAQSVKAGFAEEKASREKK
jgi:hypothetical protein